MKLFKLTLISVALCAGLSAQTTTTFTTLSAAVNGRGNGTLTTSASPQQIVCLTSSTGVNAPQFNSTTAQTELVIDREAMIVNASTPNSGCWLVTRGWDGTSPAPHASGATVWVGPTGGFLSSPFSRTPPSGGVGSPCTAVSQDYLPLIVIGSEGYQDIAGSVWNCPSAGTLSGVWQMINPQMVPNGVPVYTGTETGANNALVVTAYGLPLRAGTCMTVQLAHTLQVGANTIALNGGTALGIKSHLNTANNIATVYAATGVWTGCYNGTLWTDSSQ